ncbi:zona pellucida-like domain-containing protein [Ditylenchus destructor]|nr:zona pellucida-like domain-containing protein [Ditylenchus destructor]
MRGVSRIILLETEIPPVWLLAYLNFTEEIVDTPKVLCEENEVSLDIVTTKPFKGNVYVKGRARDNSCRRNYAQASSSSTNKSSNAYVLGLGSCGMHRLRSANPRGVDFAVTVVVSFHPDGFITKNDRAFHIHCFYMEPDEVVTSSFEVSQIPTVELSDYMGMPTCEYSVHSGSVTGPPLSYANVGETVYHVWECKGGDMGMLVKKCFVTDGAEGIDRPIVDYDGCSTDLSLLSQITYDENSMRAYAQSQAFKFADSNQIYFTCQIRMCQKKMDMCAGITPPKCGESATTAKPRAVISNNIDESTTPTKTSTTISPSESLDEEPSAEWVNDDAFPQSTSTESNSRRKRQFSEHFSSKNTDYATFKSTRKTRDSLMELDVAAPQMMVLDREERQQIKGHPVVNNKVNQGDRLYSSVLGDADTTDIFTGDTVCLSKATLSLLPFLAFTLMALTVCVTIICYKLCFMERTKFGDIAPFFAIASNSQRREVGDELEWRKESGKNRKYLPQFA